MGSRSPCEHSISPEASVPVAVMTTAGSPGGLPARNAAAWLVVTDGAIHHPHAGSRRTSRGSPQSDFLSAAGAHSTIEAASALSQSCHEMSLSQKWVRCLACGSSSFVRTRTGHLRRISRRFQPKVLILKMSGLPVQNKTLLSGSHQHRRSPSDKASC